VGLRESKKLHTRQEIADRAMHLFARRGFDHVTVAEVAEAANVSEKTVYNYFPTKEDLFFDEVPEREAALVAAITGRRRANRSFRRCGSFRPPSARGSVSPGFATFARIIEESTALKAKELEVMSRFVQVLTETLQAELGLDERDARLTAGLLVSVHRQLFRAARKQALAGKHGPPATRRLRADLDRAYHLLEHGLGELERPSQDLNAIHTA
jgi:AcrR family transcriptional regulator